jgi:hypothetical protein
VTVNLLPSSTALSIPDAWAAYISSNSVQITANVISSIATVNVQGAEYFLNAITGTNGAGSAMSASNSVFGSTNVTAVATFTPTFAYGTRQVIYLHAKGSDGLWTLFDPVILNPNANDVLNKVQANYSQMGDVSYSVSVSYFINGVSQQSPVTFTMQQKGGYMSRQTESADGLVTIVNATSTAYVNSNGVYQDGFEVDTLTNMLLGVTSTNGASYYWDVPGFTNAFPSVTGSTITNSANGSATFNSTPADTSAVSVVNFTVDMGRGVPVQETYQGADGTVQQIQHGAPGLVGPSVWLPSSEQVTVTYPNGLVIQWQTAITNAVINQGLSDSLFAIPPPP